VPELVRIGDEAMGRRHVGINARFAFCSGVMYGEAIGMRAYRST
jgi:hypothetical protein